MNRQGTRCSKDVRSSKHCGQKDFRRASNCARHSWSVGRRNSLRQLRATCVSRDAALRAISQPELPGLLPAMDGRAMHLARVFHGRRAIMAELCLSFPTSRFPLLPTQRSLSFLNPCALDKSLIREELQNKHTISTICRNSSDVLGRPSFTF